MWFGIPCLLVDECDVCIELVFLEFGMQKLTFGPEILAPKVMYAT